MIKILFHNPNICHIVVFLIIISLYNSLTPENLMSVCCVSIIIQIV